MADIKQVVTERDAVGVDDTGDNVRQTSRQVHTETAASKSSVAANLVWFLFGIIAILLATRFVLKLTGANANNGFASFIYSVSGVLSAPFDSLFGTPTTTVGTTQSIFQPSVLVAIAVYALVAYGIVRLINIAKR